MGQMGSYRLPDVEHALVSDAQPTGMISALDIAGVVGWGES